MHTAARRIFSTHVGFLRKVAHWVFMGIPDCATHWYSFYSIQQHQYCFPITINNNKAAEISNVCDHQQPRWAQQFVSAWNWCTYAQLVMRLRSTPHAPLLPNHLRCVGTSVVGWFAVSWFPICFQLGSCLAILLAIPYVRYRCLQRTDRQFGFCVAGHCRRPGSCWQVLKPQQKGERVPPKFLLCTAGHWDYRELPITRFFLPMSYRPKPISHLHQTIPVGLQIDLDGQLLDAFAIRVVFGHQAPMKTLIHQWINIFANHRVSICDDHVPTVILRLDAHVLNGVSVEHAWSACHLHTDVFWPLKRKLDAPLHPYVRRFRFSILFLKQRI